MKRIENEIRKILVTVYLSIKKYLSNKKLQKEIIRRISYLAVLKEFDETKIIPIKMVALANILNVSSDEECTYKRKNLIFYDYF